MNSATDLLNELLLRKADLRIEGGNLKVRAPKGSVSRELLEQVSRRKSEILQLLRRLPPLRRRGDGALPRASFAQQRLWVLDQFEPGSSAYNLPMVHRFKGRLDIGALQRAVDDLVERHESLRTTFASVDGMPMQVIAPELAVVVEEEAVGSEQALEERLKVLCAEPFDLAVGPLFRARVLRLNDTERVLFLMTHHIVSDGWSIGVLFRELSALYAGHLKRERVSLPVLPVQYADYAVWQREWLKGDELERQVAYWKEKLAGAPAVLELPTDRPRPAVQSHRGSYFIHEVPAQLGKRLEGLAQRHGCTLFMVMLAAFKVLLSRWTGQQDLVVGTPIAGRQLGELEGLIGFFVNTLVLRTDLSGDPAFVDVVQQVRRSALDAYAHQELPFEKLVEELRPERNTAHAPIVQVLFGLYNERLEPLQLDGLEALPQSRPVETAKFDLVVQVAEGMGGQRTIFQYNTDLFDPSTIQRMASHYGRLLEEVVEKSVRRISELPLLSAPERRQLLEEWTATGTDYPARASIAELFEAQAKRAPQAVALECEGEELTYKELNARANRLAHYLAKQGVRRETRVGLCVERSVEMVVATLAILKAGGAYVPLDPEYPEQRLAFMLEDTGAPVLLTQERLRERLPAYAGKVIALDTDWKRIARASGANPKAQASGASLAYVIYTSGSTGRPKGTLIEQKSVVRLVRNTNYLELTPEEVFLQFAPISFDASTLELWGPLLNGGRLVLAPAGRLSLEELARVIKERGITTLWLTAALFNQMVDSQPEALKGVRQLLAGGEALSVPHVRRFLEGIGKNRLINGYGPTENTTFTCCHVMRAGTPLGPTVPIGRAISNSRVYILDSQRNPVPVGVVGELYIGGAGLARGYLNQPELTAEKFVPDPFNSGERLYRTGDLVRYTPEGVIEFQGRADTQVKVRGFRIELGEIESALGSHPALRETVVLAREDTPGDKRLVAYVVATDPPADLAERLRAHLRATLPEYMVPSAFVVLDALPLTPNGKVDRKALPAPEYTGAGEYVAPRNATEESLAAIWAEVLKVERVGIHDNFFELGGHSLLAVTLIERMRRAGLNADVRALFTAPTLAELAKAVGGESDTVAVPANAIPANCEAITPEMLPLVALTPEEIGRIVKSVPGGAANVQDIYPLAPLQEGILFHHLMAREGDPYLLRSLAAFDTRARLDGYLKALQAVIDRHDILRTGMVWEGLSEPVQVVWRSAPLAIEEVSLNPAQGDIAEQLRARFDPRRYRLEVSQAPLLRVFMAHDAANHRWVMLLLLHHLVSDHTALEVVQQEIQAYLLGQANQLPKPLPFRNFVAQARLGVAREEHEAYFKQLLGDVDEPTAPFGLIDVQGEGTGVVEVHRPIDAPLARRLRERARALGVSAASLCHLAYAQVLARTSGREDVVFGTVLFGRMQGGEGAERVLGLFINTLPVRIRVGEASVQDSVKSTHAQLAQLLRHEHASLALAQRASSVAAPAPLFSALMNYRHSAGVAQAPTAQAREAWQGVQYLGGEERTNYPLLLSVEDLGEGFGLTVQAQSPMDPERICGYMHRALEELAEALERAPATPVCALDVLPAPERRLLLEQWNDTKSDYPAQALMHELFEAQAARTPGRIAVVHEERELTYGELNARANRLAHHLRSLGVKPDARVAICVERGIEMVVGLLAVLKAGGAYVPLDPAYPAERLIYMLEDSAPVAILTDARVPAELRSALTKGATAIPVIDLEAAAPAWAAQPATNPGRTAGLSSAHLAYVIYTSGSTGKPKGVAIEHRNAVNFLDWARDSFSAEQLSRTLFSTSLNFDLAMYECFAPLVVGATTRVVRNALELVQTPHPVTLINTVPSAIGALLDAAGVPQTVRTVNLAGEPLKRALTERLFAQTPVDTVCNLYGPSETTTYSTWVAMRREDGFVPHIGRPIANTRIYLLNARGQPVPVGVVGELYIGGAGVARGYLNRPELTAERFLRDPFAAEPDARMYRTGDLARYLADGNIEFLGRNDFQVKIRGYRIELGEIEAALGRHPAVREVVMLAREDTPGDKRLVAYVVAKGEAPSSAELKDYLGSRLPQYMVPAAFVILEKLPLTPNGKLDRKALPAPDGASHAGYEAPVGEVEGKLAQIWAEVLKLERVGRHDNFFELGGHSLLAVTLVEHMRRAGLSADVRELFATPTVAELAQAAQGESDTVAVPPNLIPAGCAAITPEMLPLAKLTPDEIGRIVSTVPGGASNIQDIYPLAPLQEGILFHHLMAREGDPYLLRSLAAFDSRSRLDNYLAALQAVIERHDILRTAVVWEGLAEPVQVVWRKASLIVEEVKLNAAQSDIAEQLRARFDPRRYRLDVRQAPLLRVFIAEDRANARWVIQLLFHHLAIDHTALDVMQQEMQAYLLGQERTLPVPLPYRNFVAQARLGVPRAEHEAYFKKLLGDVDEPTAPFGLTDVQGDGSGITEARLPVDEPLARRLRERARTLGVSAASLCHLAYAQVLARTSGRDDVVFGTVLFGRMQGGEGAERVMGLFINTLPVRIRVGEAGVEESVRQTHAQLAQLLRHEHASLALAQRASSVAAPAPLFSSLLNYRHSGVAAEAASTEARQAWQGVHYLGAEERTNYPLVLSVDDLGEGLALKAQTQSLDPQRICTYMHRALEELVQALETAPAAALRTLDVLAAPERRQLLEAWTATGTDYPERASIAELFEAQVKRAPQAVALEFEGQTLSYEELNTRANRLAHYLKKQGVERETRVGLCVERGLEMVVATLGILKAGGAYVPLDPEYPGQRLAFMLEDTQAPVLLTQASLRERLPEYAGTVIELDGHWKKIARESAANPKAQASGASLAYVIYTSGSTGRPKGTLIEQKSVVRLVKNTNYIELTPDEVFLQFAPISFDASTLEIWGPLLNGGRLVVAPAGRLSLQELGALIRERGITTLWLTAALFNQMVDSQLEALKGVKQLLAGGEALSVPHVRRFLQGIGANRLINGYGPTENTTFTCCHVMTAGTPLGHTVPIGRPIANSRVYILDSHREPVPVGVVGELYIGGAGLARGYLNQPQLTEEKFVPDPFSPGERLYRTGDLVRYTPEGLIEFQGRVDNQVKVRGFRIELGEIEAALASHPAVRETVVLAREDSPGDKRLVAYVVAGEPGADVTDALRAHLRERLPEYMVPAAFVTLESLPLTPNGKVDRRALPAPEYAGAQYVAPRNATEEKLAQIWAEVLKLERVGIHDNFFELGGHSLLAVTLIERMRRAGLHADVRALFTTSTLADLAQAVGAESDTVAVPANAIPAECTAITPQMLPLAKLTAEEIGRIERTVPGGASNIQDIYPLAPLQEGILFHHLMAREGDPYLLYGMASFDTRGRLDLYLQALQSVIDRHDILRTGVLWEGLAEPVQVVWRSAPLAVEEVSLDPAQGDVAEQLRARFDPRRYRLDISQAPLLRVFIAEDQANSRWVLLRLFHHLAIDHTTSEVVQQEVRAHLLGQAGKLPVPLPFRNFVAQARLGVSREEHEAYFKQLLGDVEEPTAPFGVVDVQGDGSGIVEVRHAVDRELARRLRERARALGVSAASLCHLAYAQVLARVSGRDDVVFGTVLFGRMQGGEGAERVLGLFINTLPVRIRVGEAGVEESVRSTHAQLAQLLRHEHASLALAQRCSAVAAPAPLFSALLNYRHSAAAPRVSAEARQAWEGVKSLGGEERTNYPFVLSVDDLGEGFILTAQMQSPIDPARVCAYMLRALEGLVGALERAPAEAVHSIDVLPAPERRQLISGWNRAVSYPKGACLHERFERQVERTPQAVALIFEGQRLTYAELNARANRLAHRLRELGVRADQLVGLRVERGLEMVVGILGILKAGGAYLPLDPAYPKERIGFMLEDSRVSVVVAQKALAADLEGLAVTAVMVDEPLSGAESNPAPVARAENLAYVIYTSGSTGRPKGAQITHYNVTRLMEATEAWYGFDRNDVWTLFHSYAFDFSVWELWGALLYGGRVVIVPYWVSRSPEEFRELLIRERVTVLNQTPSAFRQLIQADLGRPKGELALRTVIFGGEALELQSLRPWFERYGDERPLLVNMYGITETTVHVTYRPIRLVDLDSGQGSVIGEPIPDLRVYILDAHGEPAPIGVPGELYVGGAGVARGYLNREELTAQRFVADPFNPGARLYRTGDLARRLANGDIEYLGRIDEQVKVRGFRIELGEIEAALASHPAVRETVVLAREDSPGDKRLVAYVVAGEPGADVTDALRAHLRERLPEYMVPAAFVTLESLPLTPNGKVDRRALPAPEYAGAQYVAPRNATEEKLAQIWAEVLKLERVGIHDNFFELGGHSLLAVTLIERMRRAGLHADVRALFTTSTLADLAQAVGAESDTVAVPANAIPAECTAITPQMLPLAKLTAEEIGRIERTVPGGASNIQDIYPLAPLQEGILFHHLMAREGDPYLLYGMASFDTRGRLDLYLQALQSVIDRHDILRTGVLWEGLAEPVQVVWRSAPLAVEEVSLDPAQGDVAEQLRARFDPRRYRLDISQAPLLRVFIAEDQANSRWVLLRLFHHLAIDHTTSEVVQQEVRAHLLGQAGKLPVPLPFRNFVAQARLGVSREEHEAYFKQLLGDVEEPTAPFGVVDVQGDGSGIVEVRHAVDRELARRLRERARALGVSAASLCHLAYAQVLARVSGRDDVVFGTVLFGRMQGGEGAERVLGLFINTLPVRIRVGEAGVEESVRSTHAQLAQLLRHEHASLALAQRCSAVAAPAPLFSALLNYRHSAAAPRVSAEARQAWEGVKSLGGEERTNYPFVLSVDDLGEGFILTAQMQSPIDPARVCAYMLRALEGLVGALERAPAEAVHSIDVLPAPERRQLISGWNRAVSYPKGACLHERFERQVERTPQAVALIFEGQRLTYAELNARANRLAHRLRELGVRADQLVGLRVERGLEMVVGILGILKAGGAYLPLDPAYPKERIGFMLEDSRVSVVVAQKALAADLEGLAVTAVMVDEPLSGAESNPAPVARAENLAYVIYTSGSTGRPKGAQITHYNVTRLMEATEAWYGFDRNDVWTLFHSYAFDFSVWELWGALLYGGRVVIVPYWVSRSPEEFRELLIRERVTVLNQTPSAFRQLIQADLGRPKGELALRTVIFGGEALELQSLRPWFERYGDERPLLVNMYGITETTVHVTYRPIRLVDLDSGQGSVIGEPIPDLRVYILDAHGEPAPIGVPGELYVGGAGVARGYLNREELTAQRFVADPFNPGARLYRTGDLARRLANGDIEYLGRIDEQVKVRGFRIELGEIEAALASHPAVRETVVLAREDSPGDKRLVAYVVAGEPGADVTDALRAHLRERLPEYMVPAAFVTLESLPLTPNGKVDRRALPAPEYAGAQYVAPRNATEEKLAQIWAEVLKLERVGIHDNFFELGGHSLLATQLLARVRQELSVELPLRQLFETPTISAVATRIEALRVGVGAVSVRDALNRQANFGKSSGNTDARVEIEL